MCCSWQRLARGGGEGGAKKTKKQRKRFKLETEKKQIHLLLSSLVQGLRESAQTCFVERAGLEFLRSGSGERKSNQNL